MLQTNILWDIVSFNNKYKKFSSSDILTEREITILTKGKERRYLKIYVYIYIYIIYIIGKQICKDILNVWILECGYFSLSERKAR